MDYRIFPPEEILETTVELPPSKSAVARTLTMDFIGGGCRPLDVAPSGDDGCEDIDVLAKAYAAGVPTDGGTIDVGASGTALRLLTAVMAACEGSHCRITGTDGLRSRPVGPLVEALRVLGADIRCTVREGYAPLEIFGRRLAGGSVDLDPSASSQYATALMLASPLMSTPLTIKYTVATASGPYVRLTAAMMSARGVHAEADAEGVAVGPGNYGAGSGEAERDWSAAAFWYEIAAVTAGWVTLPGLDARSKQPDVAAINVFGQLGVTTEEGDDGVELSANPEVFSHLDLDMSNTPDLVPPTVVAACLVGVPFRLDGVGTLRFKECDRLAALRDEMLRIGCVLSLENYDNTLVWDGTRIPVRTLPEFDSHGDHRMAMAVAATAVFVPGIVVRGAECVAKSYPRFWQHLESAGFRLVDPSEPLPQVEEDNR